MNLFLSIYFHDEQANAESTDVNHRQDSKSISLPQALHIADCQNQRKNSILADTSGTG